MKKILLRVLAFALDIGVCSLIIFGLSMLNFINPNNDKINEQYKLVNQNKKIYDNLVENINIYFEDGMLSDTEFVEISVMYPDYVEAFQDLKINEDIKNKEIEKVKDKIIINLKTTKITYQKLSTVTQQRLLQEIHGFQIPGAIIKTPLSRREKKQS